MEQRIFRTGIGQDSHKFFSEKTSKPCILGGIVFEEAPGIEANSDGDFVYHAICNAISSVTTVPILGGIAHELFVKDGITDSERSEATAFDPSDVNPTTQTQRVVRFFCLYQKVMNINGGLVEIIS